MCMELSLGWEAPQAGYPAGRALTPWLLATDLKPSGSLTASSPWLIHTLTVGLSRLPKSVEPGVMSMGMRPYSPPPVAALTSPPSRWVIIWVRHERVRVHGRGRMGVWTCGDVRVHTSAMLHNQVLKCRQTCKASDSSLVVNMHCR